MLSMFLIPILRYQGYRKVSLDLGLPESNYFMGEDSLGSLNQIHKRYLSQTGWIESKNSNQSVRLGEYIPWTSYAFTHWIEPKNLSNFSILEFGSGASTIYWASKFGNVYTIESDIDWLIKVSQVCANKQNVEVHSLIGSNAQTEIGKEFDGLRETFAEDLRLFPELEFEFNFIDFNLINNCIAKSRYFFVDGGPRNLYMEILAKSVNDDAVIIVDNSDQYYTKRGREILLECGFKEIEFNSLGPLNHSATSTSVFVKQLESL